LLHRIQDAVDEKLRREQAGFRKGRSCQEQIFTLRQIIEKVISGTDPILINFIGFKKAFDSVHRPSVWKILKSYGFPEKLINIIKAFYMDSRCAVRAEGQLSDWFQIVTGVRQGCILSPLIFLIVIDWVMKQATSSIPIGLEWLNNEHLVDLDFADDIALIDMTQTRMQEITHRVEKSASHVGLYIDAAKTKAMPVSSEYNTSGDILVDGNPIEYVEEFCYLGSIIQHNSSCDADIRSRIGKANSVFARLNRIWKDRKLSQQIKMRLYESLILSTLLYSAETWNMTVVNRKKLKAAHHRLLRKILRISWVDRVTNEEVRRRTGQESLETIITQSTLVWAYTQDEYKPASSPST